MTTVMFILGLLVITALPVALVVLLMVIYLRVQEQREQELARKLLMIYDPVIAALEADRIKEQYRHEAGFFRWLTEHVWPILFSD